MSVPIMLSPAETVSESAPASDAALRCAANTTARRAAPPLMVPLPAEAGGGKSSLSGAEPSRCECSSLVCSSTSLRGDLLLLQPKANKEKTTAARRIRGSPSVGARRRQRLTPPVKRRTSMSGRRPLSCAHRDRQHVFTRRNGAVVELREGASRVVGAVEVEEVLVAAERLGLDIAAHRIALVPRGRIAEEHRDFGFARARLEQ